MELDDLWSAAVTGDQDYYKEVVEPHRNRLRNYYAQTHSSSHNSKSKQTSSVLGGSQGTSRPSNKDCSSSSRTSIGSINYSVGDRAGDEGQTDYYEHRPKIYSGRSYEEGLFDEQNKLRAKEVMYNIPAYQQRDERPPVRTYENESDERNERANPHYGNEVDASPPSRQMRDVTLNHRGLPEDQVEDRGYGQGNDDPRRNQLAAGERMRRNSNRSQKQWEDLDKRINRLVSECLQVDSASSDGEGNSKEDESATMQRRSRNIDIGRREERIADERESMVQNGSRDGRENIKRGFWEDDSKRERRGSDHERMEVIRDREIRDRERHDSGYHDESSQGSSSDGSSGRAGGEQAVSEERPRQAEYGGLRMRNHVSESVGAERRWVDRGLTSGLNAEIGRKRCFSEGHRKMSSPRPNRSENEPAVSNQSEDSGHRFQDPYRQQQPDTRGAPSNNNGKNEPQNRAENPHDKKQDIKQMLIDAGNQSVQNYRNLVEQGRFIARTYVKPPVVAPVMKYTYTVSYPVNYGNVVQTPSSNRPIYTKPVKNRKKKAGSVNVDVTPSPPSVPTIDIADSDDEDVAVIKTPPPPVIKTPPPPGTEDEAAPKSPAGSTSSSGEGVRGNPIVL